MHYRIFIDDETTPTSPTTWRPGPFPGSERAFITCRDPLDAKFESVAKAHVVAVTGSSPPLPRWRRFKPHPRAITDDRSSRAGPSHCHMERTTLSIPSLKRIDRPPVVVGEGGVDHPQAKSACCNTTTLPPGCRHATAAEHLQDLAKLPAQTLIAEKKNYSPMRRS